MNADGTAAILNASAILSADGTAILHPDGTTILNNVQQELQHTVLPVEMKGESENAIGNPIASDLRSESTEREIEIKETEFGWIEYTNKLSVGEYTISFGDSTSHPF